jgi:hypothetical protein
VIGTPLWRDSPAATTYLLLAVLSLYGRRRRLFLIGTLPLVVFIGQALVARAASATGREPESQAALLFRVNKQSDFSFSANLTLPRIKNNKGQYSIWILVGDLKGSLALPALIQTGLLWWKPNKYVLQPFVGIEPSGGSMQTLLSPPLEDSMKEHQFRLTRSRNELTAYMDSKQLFSVPWHNYFRDGDDEHIYLRIASEVLSGGDTVSGTVREIAITTPSGTIKPYLPVIADEDRGPVFVCRDHIYVATGTFDSKKLTEPYWFQPPRCEEK